MNLLKTYLTLLLLCLLGKEIKAQQDSVSLKGTDLNSILFINENLESNRIPRLELLGVLELAKSFGYWLATLDSVSVNQFHLQLGAYYDFQKIQLKASEELLGQFPKLYNRSPFQIDSYRQLHQFKETQLKHLENHGYPFALIQLSTNDDLLIPLDATITEGPLVFWDSTIVKGDYQAATSLIKIGLQAPRNNIYSEQEFERITKRRHPNINYLKAPEILFVGNKAHLFLYVKEVSKNSIGGLLGFNGSKGNFNIIGNVDLKLNNKFHRFETVELNWQAYDDRSQKLNLTLKLPHLFKSVFGFSGQLNVLKQDSSFVNYNVGSNLSYYLNNKHQIATGVRFETSNSLQSIESSSTFDVKKKLYLINYEFHQLSGIFRNLKAEFAAGNRNSNNNTQNYAQALIESSVLVPIYKWLSFYTNVEGQKMLGDQLSSNELFRIGGFNSIRGFNELSLSAQGYVFANTELRLRIDANSFIFGFTDFGKIETLQNTNNLLGFGLGVQLNSKTGKFAIAYGLGKFDNTPIDFSASKIHFGYINEF